MCDSLRAQDRKISDQIPKSQNKASDRLPVHRNGKLCDDLCFDQILDSACPRGVFPCEYLSLWLLYFLNTSKASSGLKNQKPCNEQGASATTSISLWRSSQYLFLRDSQDKMGYRVRGVCRYGELGI